MTSAEFAERTSADVQAEARRNLAALLLSWEQVSPTLLRGVDHDFAAEMLMDPSCLQAARRILGADTIVVGVPRRRTIFASSAAAGSPEETAFVRAVWEAGRDDRNDSASITNLLFRLDRDQVVGFEIVYPPGSGSD